MEKFTYLTYIPFIGWMFPMAVQGNSEFVMTHARQGLIMAFFTTGSVMALMVLSVMIPSSWSIVRLIVVILVYLVYALYFGLCLTGAWFIHKRRTFEFPVIKDFTGKLGF